MAQMGKIKQYGDQFTMEVELGEGHKERWTYQRTHENGLTSFIMVNREDL